MLEYIWILVPLGLLIGWFAAKRDIAKKQKILHYLNLRYLLEGQSKEDINDIPMDFPLDDDMEALNFSLILGDAFRKRGEIDRAINLHEYVIKQTENGKLFYKAHVSLAEDFLAAGFFDKAEESLRFLIESEDYRDFALRKLAALYEQQRDWLQALNALERLSIKDSNTVMEISHLYCELAEEALAKTNSSLEDVVLWVEKALEADLNCARANLIKVRVSLQYNKQEIALKNLLKIEQQQVSLIPIIVPAVYRLSYNLDKIEFFHKWLDHAIEQKDSHYLLKLWKVHYLILNESLVAGVDYLKRSLHNKSNLQGLLLLNNLLFYLEKNQENLAIYDQTFNSVVDYYARYQCNKCGLATKTLQWHCPSCKQWNTNAPVSDIIALKR